jgi:hypothetical protein
MDVTVVEYLKLLYGKLRNKSSKWSDLHIGLHIPTVRMVDSENILLYTQRKSIQAM